MEDLIYQYLLRLYPSRSKKVLYESEELRLITTTTGHDLKHTKKSSFVNLWDLTIIMKNNNAVWWKRIAFHNNYSFMNNRVGAG